MKLGAWAKEQGISYRTALNWFHAGTLPVPARQLPTGTILVDPPAKTTGTVVAYCRVCAHDQKADLERQAGRVLTLCSGRGVRIDRTVTEIGSGLNGRGTKLRKLLGDPEVATIVVEHRDRLARFGVEYLEAALAAHGRMVVVLDDAEPPDDPTRDLARDLTEVLTCMCARLYGRRSASRRAAAAVAAIRNEPDDAPGDPVVIRAYLFALDPTEEQVQAFRSHCGAQRYAYNFGVELAGKIRAQRAAEYSYGLRGAELTPCSAYDLRKAWNAAKHERAPWWRENSKEAYSSGLANAAAAFKNFGDSFRGTRRGPKVRYPRFKSKHRVRLTCRFTTGAFGLTDDRRHVKLPRIGVVRTHESTRKLARRVEAGTARILSATLSFQRGRWHVSLSVELPDVAPPAREHGRVVGVDLGIKSLAVLSTGEVVENPRHLDRDLARLRRLQRRCARRRGPDRRTRQKPSRRWRQTKRQVAALHTRVANARRDGLHKLTTRLVRDHDVVVVEDLNVAGMVRNKRLARHIGQLGMGEFRRQIQYKADQAGVRVHVADRWFPSSKTCSACGAVRAKLTLAEREFVCESCGTRIDRDFNAALNLAALADRVVQGELRPDVKPTVETQVRPPVVAARTATDPPAGGRQAPVRSQRHHREAVAR